MNASRKIIMEEKNYGIFSERSKHITVYRLKQLVEKKFGFYICCEDNLQTMDDFVRDLPDTEITYYFGTTIDYHC